MAKELSFAVQVCTLWNDRTAIQIEETIVELDAEESAPWLLEDGMYDVAEIVEQRARKNVASRHIPYEEHIEMPGNNDSSYLDALDNLADQYRVIYIGLVGDQVRFEVDGQYDSNDQPWSDDIMAVDEIDAEFKGRWALVEGEGGSPLDQTFSEMTSSMDNQTIHWVTKKAVSLTEAIDLLSRAYADHRDGADPAATMDEIRAVLTKLNALPPEPAATMAP